MSSLQPTITRVGPWLSLALGLVLLATIRPPTPREQPPEQRLIPPPQMVEHLAFGYRETMADLLWIRLLQDAHICEQVEGGVAHVEGVVREGPACHLSWVYLMMDKLTDLAPRWKLPFSIFGTMLSVIVDDREGARRILEKAIQRFPHEWDFRFQAGYHYLWEMKDEARAAELMLQAAHRGAPPWVYALAANLMSQQGQAAVARAVLEDAIARGVRGPGEERLRLRLEQIERDLKVKPQAKPQAQPPQSARPSR
ncbi:MAG TPA: hypothetical protein PLZ57_11575 [Pseudobdellovibrionaceae bacterium]|nr:hypothetical protein [Pseudobdellovibrionaceae bacterium]